MFDMLTSPYTHPLKRLIWMRLKAGARAVWETITGNPITFTAKSAPLKQLQVSFGPVQDLHGYENPWPAGGGKNKIDSDVSAWEQGQITNGGGRVDSTTRIRTKTYYRILPNTTYTISVSGDLIPAFHMWTEDETYISDSGWQTELPYTFTTPNNAAFIQFTCRKTDTNARINPSVMGDTAFIQLELGSSATSYAPYANECPISGWTGFNVAQAGNVNLFDPNSPYHWVINPGYERVENEASRSIVLPCSQGDLFTISCQRSSGSKIIYYAFADENGTILSRVGSSTSAVLTGTAPANAAFLYAGAADYTTNFDWVQVELGSTASEYTPFNGQTIPVTFPAIGVNQWDEETEFGYYRYTDGEPQDATNQLRTKNYIPVKPNTEYYAVTPATVQLIYYNSNKEYLGYKVWFYGKFTAPSDCYYIRANLGGSYGTAYNHDVSINYPSTKTSYEPYTNVAYSGWMNLVTGDGELTSAVFTDAGSVNWNMATDSYIGETISRAYSVTGDRAASNPWSKMNYLKKINGGDQMNGYYYDGIRLTQIKLANSLTGIVYGEDTRQTAIEKFKAYFAAHPIQYVYEIAPIPFHIDPQEIRSLLGTNTMWSDANGDITAEYRAS